MVCHPKKAPNKFTSNSIFPIVSVHIWWVPGGFFWGAKPTGKFLLATPMHKCKWCYA
jgi:hypothetical protein